MNSKNETGKKVVRVAKITEEQYQLLEKRLGRIGVDHGTTAHEAGFQLGAQAVLKALRDGFVVPSS